MEVSAIRDTMHAQPFRPFRLRLADGRMLLVRHPDFIAVAPEGRRVVVFNEPDGAMSILEPLLIVSVETDPAGPVVPGGGNEPSAPNTNR